MNLMQTRAGVLLRRGLALPVQIPAIWIMAGLLHLLHADVLLLLVMWLAVSALLRSGRTLLDRLMLGAFALAGVLMAGGLLFSLWPFRLHPVTMAGVVLTGLAVAGRLSGRGYQLPRKLLVSDAVVLGIGLVDLLALLRPLRGGSPLSNLTFGVITEDRIQHFTIFDSIHRLGGFLFLHQEQSRQMVFPPTEEVYPVGAHYLYTVADVFVRSTTDPGPSLEAFNRYLLLAMVGHAVLITSVVWAARWVVEPLLRGWRQIAATAVVGTLALLTMSLSYLVQFGADSAVVGVTFVVVTLAIAMRSGLEIRERMLLLGTGVMLVGFTYYLFVPLVAAGAAVCFWLRRGQVWRNRWTLAGSAAIALVAVVPLYFMQRSTFSMTNLALSPGARPPTEYQLMTVVTIGLLLLGPVLGRRSRTVSSAALTMLAMVTVITAFGVYQTVKLGEPSYYFYKLLVPYQAMAMVSVGLLFTLLRRSSREHEAKLWRETALGVGIAATMAVVIAGITVHPYEVGQRKLSAASLVSGPFRESPLVLWARGKQRSRFAPSLQEMNQAGLLADGTATLFFISSDPNINWPVTFMNLSLNRHAGPHQEVLVDMLSIAPQDGSIGQLKKALDDDPGPWRIVVRDQATAAAIRKMLAEEPTLQHNTVFVLPFAS